MGLIDRLRIKMLLRKQTGGQYLALSKICGWGALVIVALLFLNASRVWDAHAMLSPTQIAGHTWWYALDYVWKNLLYLLRLTDAPHFSVSQQLAVENVSTGLFALMVGAVLAVPGVSFQAFFQNPISAPSVLGLTNACGAGFAICVALGLYSEVMNLSLFSFPFLLGFGSVLLVLVLSILLGHGRIHMDLLILAGVVSSSFFNTIYLAVQYTLEPGKQQILNGVYLGHLNGLPSGEKAVVFYCALLIGIVPMFLLGYRMNLLSFGREQARALGVHTNVLGLVILLSGTLVEVVVLLFCGMIGWIGLVVPHLARFCVGAEIRRVLPVSMLFGGIFLLITDLLNLPAGMGAPMIGVPIFLYLLAKNRGVKV